MATSLHWNILSSQVIVLSPSTRETKHCVPMTLTSIEKSSAHRRKKKTNLRKTKKLHVCVCLHSPWLTHHFSLIHMQMGIFKFDGLLSNFHFVFSFSLAVLLFGMKVSVFWYSIQHTRQSQSNYTYRQITLTKITVSSYNCNDMSNFPCLLVILLKKRDYI